MTTRSAAANLAEQCRRRALSSFILSRFVLRIAGAAGLLVRPAPGKIVSIEWGPDSEPRSPRSLMKRTVILTRRGEEPPERKDLAGARSRLRCAVSRVGVTGSRLLLVTSAAVCDFPIA